MSLYPSLEDMKVDHMGQAQQAHTQQQQQQQHHAIGYGSASAPSSQQAPSSMLALYPSLGEFMGMEVSHDVVRQNLPEEVGNEVVTYQSSNRMVAPITGESNVGMARAEVKQGIRMVVACKGQDGKLGLRVQHVNKGVFISLVSSGSPAALAGLRFGDQILQINGTTVAGMDRDKVMNLIKKADGARIELAIRDRPFERTITLQKDSTGHVGFIFKDGKITKLVKDSSAARNGLLIEHNILEVNGQNVVGLKDKAVSEILSASDRSMTLTIIPTFIYDHMMKCMKSSLVKKDMDHSIPDL